MHLASDGRDELGEEFNNFMYRVTEVGEIIKKMNSGDKSLQEIGTLEADKYLNRDAEAFLENIDEKDVVLKVKSDRTVLNRKAIAEKDDRNQDEMSQEGFMAAVSKDAEKRHRDRAVRTEKMETFKRQATLAFRKGEYERALSCYNKAIDQIRDSPLLYNNRCLTYLRLSMFDKAIDDAQTALKLNEDCLKSYLFLAKAHFYLRDMRSYRGALKQARERNPKSEKFIEDFAKQLEADAQFNNVE